MTVSVEEALSVLRKWENDGSLIRMQLSFSGINGLATGRVGKVAEDSISVVAFPEPRSADDLPSTLITVSLVLVHSFAFVDPRDGTDREALAAEMDFGVIAYFTTGESCAWYALPLSD